MERHGSRRALGIVLIGCGALVLLCGAVDGSTPVVVGGCVALALGATFVAVGREPSGGSAVTEVGPPAQDRSDPPVFTATLRGYDKLRVDELVGRCEEALGSGEVSRIGQAKAELDEGRFALPVALNGYHREQVDEFLERLSALLAQRLTADG